MSFRIYTDAENVSQNNYVTDEPVDRRAFADLANIDGCTDRVRKMGSNAAMPIYNDQDVNFSDANDSDDAKDSDADCDMTVANSDECADSDLTGTIDADKPQPRFVEPPNVFLHMTIIDGIHQSLKSVFKFIYYRFEEAVGNRPEPCVDELTIDDDIPDTQSKQNVYENVNEFEEYGGDILKTLKESERVHRVKPKYMSRQREINHQMRGTLINWLIEVGNEYDVESETIHLMVSYIDRFLCVMSVSRTKLQLVGITALHIAAKYEETSAIEVNDLVQVADEAYTLQQVLKMEQLMLRVLKFDLCVPTAYAFLSAFYMAGNSSEETKYLAQYICELALLDGEQYLSYLPSEIAAASLALARVTLQEHIWSKKLEWVSEYSVRKMRGLIMKLAKTHAASGTQVLKALHTKYSRSLYMSVAKCAVIVVDEEVLSKAIHLNSAMKNIMTDENSTAARTENLRTIMSKLIFDWLDFVETKFQTHYDSAWSFQNDIYFAALQHESPFIFK